MTHCYLVRHGTPSWDIAHARKLPGWAADLVPLTEKGIEEARRAGAKLAPAGASLVLSSPMTRALQTAQIIAASLHLPVAVEFDLHEWVPDRTLQWSGLETVIAADSDRKALGGEWPAGEERPWEPLSLVRRRVEAVLDRYSAHSTLLVVCHGVVIESLTGVNPECCGIVEHVRG